MSDVRLGHAHPGRCGRAVQLLTFTTLYPNHAQPQHGIFVEHRLRKLVSTGNVDAAVLAPVPWFPIARQAFGRYAQFARAPQHEVRFGVDVHHPRYLVIPKIGVRLAPELLAKGAAADFRALCDRYGSDIVDAHYFYPDGVAAALLARSAGLPLVITARGSDINLIATHGGPRKRILWAAEQCEAVIAVSRALRDRMIEIGIREDRISVLPNGVDTEFFVRDEAARASLNLPRIALLTVGKLVEGKGHHLVIRALRELPDMDLVVVGGGPMRRALEKLARQLGLAGRVRFTGEQPQETLRRYYSACDVLVLASAREGMPNVVLESLACGTPVVATDVGGIGEVLASSEAGVLLEDRSPAAIAHGVRQLLRRARSPRDVRAFAETLTWEKTVSRLIHLLEGIAGSKRRRDVLTEAR